MTSADDGTLTVRVTINGTTENPWGRYGLTCNPFPQLAKAEFSRGERQIASLDGDPVTDEADLRERLAGFSAEFIELCVSQYQPGQRVRFAVTFPAARPEAQQ